MQLQEQCTICGTLQTFEFNRGDARDDGACRTCGARLKDRDAAHFLLAHATPDLLPSIKALTEEQPEVVPLIVEFAYSSALSNQLRDHPNYEQRYFWLSGRTEKTSAGHEVPFCDLHNTGFDDASKDFVVTNDAISFVDDLTSVLQEMCRVIRRGGAFIAINKVDWPVPRETIELESSAQKTYTVPDGEMQQRRIIGSDISKLFSKTGFRLMLRQVGFSQSSKRNFSLIGVRV